MMRDRTLTVLMVLALLATGWFAGRWALVSSAAPAVQMELAQAAIHPGICAAPDPERAHVLAPFERSSGPGQADGPLSSFSELPVRLEALLETPHVMLVTLGGDPAATLACGEIEDLSGGVILGIELVEVENSGVSGLGLILDDGTVTRVSIILDEPVGTPAEPVASPVGQATPVDALPTQRPDEPDVTPTPSQRDLTPTPAGPDETPTPAATDETPTPTPASVVIPSIPIGLPPIAQGTTPTPEPISEPPGDLTEYVSEEFGYSVAIPDGWRLFDHPQVQPGFDRISLTNGESLLNITGVSNVTDAATCVDNNYRLVRGLSRTVLIVPHEGPQSALATRSPELTIELWDMVILDDQDENLPITYYNECRALGDGAGVLLLTHDAPRDSYAEQAVERDLLFSGVVMP